MRLLLNDAGSDTRGPDLIARVILAAPRRRFDRPEGVEGVRRVNSGRWNLETTIFKYPYLELPSVENNPSYPFHPFGGTYTGRGSW